MGRIIADIQENVPGGQSSGHLAARALKAAGQQRAPKTGLIDVVSGLRELTSTQTFRAGEVIYRESDEALFYYEVLSGTVKEYKALMDGRRQIPDFYLEGDLFGITQTNLFPYTAEAVGEVVVRRYPRGKLESMASLCPALGRKLFSAVNEKLLSAQSQMIILSRINAVERVAAFLVRLLERTSNGDVLNNEVHLPMTRQDMAYHLGLTIESVSRALTKLRKEGIIALPETHRVAVMDWERLYEIVDGEVSRAA